MTNDENPTTQISPTGRLIVGNPYRPFYDAVMTVHAALAWGVVPSPRVVTIASTGRALRITATGEDTSVTTVTTRIPNGVQPDGRITVDHDELSRLLPEFAETVPEQNRAGLPVRVYATDSPTLAVGGHQVRLTPLPAEALGAELTPCPRVVWVQRREFDRAAVHLEPIVAAGFDRPYSTGLQLSVGTDVVSMAAVSRYRMAVASVPVIPLPSRVSDPVDATIPGRVLTRMLPYLYGARVGIGIRTVPEDPTQRETTVTFADTTVITRADHHGFPIMDLHSPDEDYGTIQVDRRRLLTQVRAALDARTTGTGFVSARVDATTLTVAPNPPATQNSTTGEVTGQPARVTGIPAGTVIGLRGPDLFAAVVGVSTDMVTLYWTGNGDPLLITGAPHAPGDRPGNWDLLAAADPSVNPTNT